MQNKGLLKSALVTEDIFLMTPSAWSSILVQQDIKVYRQPWFLVSFCKINPVKFWVTKRRCRHMSRFAGPTTVRQKIRVMWVLTADLSSFREGCCSEDGVTGLSTNIVATFTIRSRGKLCWDFCLINPLCLFDFFSTQIQRGGFFVLFFLKCWYISIKWGPDPASSHWKPQ